MNQAEFNEKFLDVCETGKFRLVDYLLNNKEICKNFSIEPYLVESGLGMACANGHVEVIKCLLSPNARVKPTLGNKIVATIKHDKLEAAKYLTQYYSLLELSDILEKLLEDHFIDNIEINTTYNFLKEYSENKMAASEIKFVVSGSEGKIIKKKNIL